MENPTRTFDTTLGSMTAEFDAAERLVRLDFNEGRTADGGTDNEVGGALVDELDQYFAGRRTTFSSECRPEGTPFQRQVWAVLETIPFGSTMSYDALARRLDNPKAIRAVGRAVGANPIAIVIPCHRVIGSDGSLTGYAGGIDRKRRLLTLEGAVPGDLWEDLEWSLEEARSRRRG